MKQIAKIFTIIGMVCGCWMILPLIFGIIHLKKMNEGYRIGARNQLATSEEQRCVSLIAQAIRREWDKESFKWYPGLKPLQVSLKLGPGGRVLGFRILVGSVDGDVDRTANSALNRLKSIPGLSATFIEHFPEIALLMEPTQGG